MGETGELLAWCVVANVTAEARLKHFAPGAKLWVMPPQWGDGGEQVVVIGRHRGRGRAPLVQMVVPRLHLTGFRARGVYHPAAHALMEHVRQWKSREEVEEHVEIWTREEAIRAGVARPLRRVDLYYALGMLTPEHASIAADRVLSLSGADGVLKDQREREGLEAVCEPLRAVVADSNGDCAAHPRWPEATAAATTARALLAGEQPDR